MMQQERGSHFDPALLDALTASLPEMAEVGIADA